MGKNCSFVTSFGEGFVYPCNSDGSVFGNFKPIMVDSSNLMDTVVRLFAILSKHGFKFF